MVLACDLQRKMAHFCRTGKDPRGVGMSLERAHVYRDLIFSTIQETLRNYYPITVALIGEIRWQELTEDFFANHPCADPQLWKMPRGLVDYAKESGWGERYQIPFLADLLHFEWLEMEVEMMPDTPLQLLQPIDDVLKNPLYLNPDHRVATYAYPIFQQILLDSPLKKGEYFVFCFRHPDTLDAHFFSLSPFFLAVIKDLKRNVCCGQDALIRAAEQCKLPINEQLFTIGKKFLEDLVKKRAILGANLP